MQVAPLDEKAAENYLNNFWYNLNFVKSEIKGHKYNGYYPGAHRSLDCMRTGVESFTLHRSRYFERTIYLNVCYLTIYMISFFAVCLGIYEIAATIMKIVSPTEYKENFMIKNFSVSSGKDDNEKDQKNKGNGQSSPPYEDQVKFSISDFKKIHQICTSSNEFPSGRTLSVFEGLNGNNNTRDREPSTESESLACEDEVSSNTPNAIVRSQNSLGEAVKRTSSNLKRERQRSYYRPRPKFNKSQQKNSLCQPENAENVVNHGNPENLNLKANLHESNIDYHHQPQHNGLILPTFINESSAPGRIGTNYTYSTGSTLLRDNNGTGLIRNCERMKSSKGKVDDWS